MEGVKMPPNIERLPFKKREQAYLMAVGFHNGMSLGWWRNNLKGKDESNPLFIFLPQVQEKIENISWVAAGAFYCSSKLPSRQILKIAEKFYEKKIWEWLEGQYSSDIYLDSLCAEAAQICEEMALAAFIEAQDFLKRRLESVNANKEADKGK